MRRRLSSALTCLLLIGIGGPLWAQLPGASDMARIGPREFVLDQAHLLSPEQRREVQGICAKLLDQRNIPIVVVSIRSMREFPGRPQQIEPFARRLFNEWGIGFAAAQQPSWNRGILMLIAKDDRQARIELGADWGRDQDAVCAGILHQQVIPRFRSGDYGGGILAGVAALDQLARSVPETAGPSGSSRLGNAPGAMTGDAETGSEVPRGREGPPPGGAFPPPESSVNWVVVVVLLIVAVRFLLPLLFPMLSVMGYRPGGQHRRGPYGPGMGGYFPGGYGGGGFSNRGGFSSFGGSSGGSSGGGGASSFGGGSSGGGGASGSW